MIFVDASILEDFIETSALSLLGLHLFLQRDVQLCSLFEHIGCTTVEVSSVQSFILLGMPLDLICNSPPYSLRSVNLSRSKMYSFDHICCEISLVLV